MKEILWRKKGHTAFEKGYIVGRKYGLLSFSDSEYGNSSVYYHPDEIDIIKGTIETQKDRLKNKAKELTPTDR